MSRMSKSFAKSTEKYLDSALSMVDSLRMRVKKVKKRLATCERNRDELRDIAADWMAQFDQAHAKVVTLTTSLETERTANSLLRTQAQEQRAANNDLKERLFRIEACNTNSAHTLAQLGVFLETAIDCMKDDPTAQVYSVLQGTHTTWSLASTTPNLFYDVALFLADGQGGTVPVNVLHQMIRLTKRIT